MTDQQRLYFHQKVKDWTERVNKHVDLNSPDMILAHAISSLFFLSVGYLGKDIMDDFARHLIDDARQRSGLCQSCDNEIPVLKSFHPICADCDTKEKVEYLKMEMEDDS